MPAAVGPAAGALSALPLGPWVELRRTRPVMMAMDLTRFAALLSIPVAFALGVLSSPVSPAAARRQGSTPTLSSATEAHG